MNIIDSVTIKGLWEESQPIHFNCDKKFNFIIGKNGTGKTTVINLIAAALTCDTEILRKIQFSQITIKFTQGGPGAKKPSLTILKEKPLSDHLSRVIYEFRDSQSDESPKTIEISKPQLESKFGSIFRWMNDTPYEIQLELKKIALVSWLSVQRTNNQNTPNDEIEKSPTAIDLKLTELKNNLVKYFSQLSQKYSKNVVEFQKKTLLSVLNPEEGLEKTISQSGGINTTLEREALESIFSMLGVEKKVVKQKIEKHLRAFENSINEYKTKKNSSLENIIAIYHAIRAHELVQDYEILEKERENIFKPKSNFIQEINALFEGRKTIFVNEKNEISFLSKNNKSINPEQLSSGEKQLIIILGEALLQDSRKAIYIADEPELSLHILWQEAITSAITRINPNAQIIFATHSPDIVGGRSENIINMEKLNP